jgi:hypothetical protein
MVYIYGMKQQTATITQVDIKICYNNRRIGLLIFILYPTALAVPATGLNFFSFFKYLY